MQTTKPELQFDASGAFSHATTTISFPPPKIPTAAPKKRKTKSATPTSEEVRKNNHKLIEQRRRQKINDKIEELRVLLAPANEGFPNKSMILEATIDTITGLRSSCTKLLAQHRLLQEERNNLLSEMKRYGYTPSEDDVLPPSPVVTNAIDLRHQLPPISTTMTSSPSLPSSFLPSPFNNLSYNTNFESKPFIDDDNGEEQYNDDYDGFISFSPSDSHLIPDSLRMHPTSNVFSSNDDNTTSNSSYDQFDNKPISSSIPIMGDSSTYRQWSTISSTTEQARNVLSDIMKKHQGITPAQLANLYAANVDSKSNNSDSSNQEPVTK